MKKKLIKNKNKNNYNENENENFIIYKIKKS